MKNLPWGDFVSSKTIYFWRWEKPFFQHPRYGILALLCWAMRDIVSRSEKWIWDVKRLTSDRLRCSLNGINAQMWKWKEIWNWLDQVYWAGSDITAIAQVQYPAISAIGWKRDLAIAPAKSGFYSGGGGRSSFRFGSEAGPLEMHPRYDMAPRPKVNKLNGLERVNVYTLKGRELATQQCNFVDEPGLRVPCWLHAWVKERRPRGTSLNASLSRTSDGLSSVGSAIIIQGFFLFHRFLSVLKGLTPVSFIGPLIDHYLFMVGGYLGFGVITTVPATLIQRYDSR